MIVEFIFDLKVLQQRLRIDAVAKSGNEVRKRFNSYDKTCVSKTPNIVNQEPVAI
jgi:hypothetical protein